MFKKVKELLENKTISTEVAEALDTEIQKELKSLRDESAGYRVKYKELEQTFNEVSNSKKSLEEQVNSLDEKIAKAKEDGKAELVKELEAEKTSKDELVKQLNALESTTKTLKIENSLNKALSGYDLIDSDIVTQVLITNIDIKDDNAVFKDGKTLEDGLKGFFEAKPHLLKAKGDAGSGREDNQSGYAKDSFTAKKLAQLKNRK